jgi:hypothetical protein
LLVAVGHRSVNVTAAASSSIGGRPPLITEAEYDQFLNTWVGAPAAD